MQRLGAAVRFQRLGVLNAVRQDQPHAPTRRGIWAFIWPHHDMFFAFHQYDGIAPARLRFAVIAAIGDPDVRNARYVERTQWIRDVAPRVLRVRPFWWQGDCYSHLGLRGELLGGGAWQRMDVRDFYVAACRYLGPSHRHVFDGRDWHVGRADYPAEVFLPAAGGHVVGRVAIARTDR